MVHSALAPWLAILIGTFDVVPAVALAYDPVGQVKGLIRDRLHHLRHQVLSNTDPAEWCKDQQQMCSEKVQQAQQELDAEKQHVRDAGGDADACLYASPSPTGCYELHAASERLQLHREEREALTRSCAGRTYGSSYEERQQRREHLIDGLKEAHELLR
mmetsp:Transcript_10694/g.24340  ORF Transcript_10694/g.24340 Transcript_10694/m.24340 type:complete len:159 (-) Transcript_10694:57-533(-)